MIKRCWIDAGLLSEEDSSGETEDYAIDRETEEEEILIRELVQECEGMELNESGNLVSDDEVEVIETEEEEVEVEEEEAVPAVEAPVERVTKLKQSRISKFFVKSDQ